MSTSGVPEHQSSAAPEENHSRMEAAKLVLSTLQAKRIELNSQSKVVEGEIHRMEAELGLLTEEYTMLQQHLGQRYTRSLACPEHYRRQSYLQNYGILSRIKSKRMADVDMMPLDIGNSILSTSTIDGKGERGADMQCISVAGSMAPNDLTQTKRNTSERISNSRPGKARIINPSDDPRNRKTQYVDHAQEIKRNTLELTDDGTFFVDPPIMRGVPLEKISPGHPYWEIAWPNAELSVQCQMGTGRGGSLGREPLSYQDVVNFIRSCEFHPYQLVGKRWMDPEGLMNRDVILPLVRVLWELHGFDLDVTPLQWLRQRLHEIHICTSDFNLSSVIVGLNLDPKLIALRWKKGAENADSLWKWVMPVGNGSPRPKLGGSKKRKTPILKPLEIPHSRSDPPRQLWPAKPPAS